MLAVEAGLADAERLALLLPVLAAAAGVATLADVPSEADDDAATAAGCEENACAWSVHAPQEIEE